VTQKVFKKVRPYLYLLPLVLLFALGVLWRTTVKTTEVDASPAACQPFGTTGLVDPTQTIAYWEGNKIAVPQEDLAMDTGAVHTKVLGVANPDERWIEVDLSDQKLKAWDGDQLFLETPISTGLPGTPTPTGEFHVWMKIRATRMVGGEGRLAYDLPNVPYVMFFDNDQVNAALGYGLHGTYWHNDFGRTHSHGCVNLPTPIAKVLYDWTTPTLAEGQNMVRASDDNPGTRIIIHQ
jgi:lipoprotein-anchoring transpeptidase ErfK/SrfK